MNKNDLKKVAGISASSVAKLGKGTNITTDVLLKICESIINVCISIFIMNNILIEKQIIDLANTYKVNLAEQISDIKK